MSRVSRRTAERGRSGPAAEPPRAGIAADSTDDPDVIADRVLRAVRPGSIIDLNVELSGKDADGQSVLVDALPQILDGLRAKHLRPVRLDTLVGGPAYQSCSRT